MMVITPPTYSIQQSKSKTDGRWIIDDRPYNMWNRRILSRVRACHELCVGSTSTSPTACPLRGCRRAGTQNDRLYIGSRSRRAFSNVARAEWKNTLVWRNIAIDCGTWYPHAWLAAPWYGWQLHGMAGSSMPTLSHTRIRSYT